MSRTDDPVMAAGSTAAALGVDGAGGDLGRLLDRTVDPDPAACGPRIAGAIVGTLVGFAEAGTVPLVVYRGQPGGAALPARTIASVQGTDIGRGALLMFEEGDPGRPIIVGCLADLSGTALPATGHVEVDADHQRLVVSAKDRIVLRCGKASITLTKEGKVILQGAYVSSQSSGVLRIKGGSVQIN